MKLPIIAALFLVAGCDFVPEADIPVFCHLHEELVRTGDEVAALRPLKKYEQKQLEESREFVRKNCS